jgi:hypothetical protein
MFRSVALSERLMPPSLDEVIGLDNVVRVIDSLDLQRVETAATDRPPYAPGADARGLEPARRRRG